MIARLIQWSVANKLFVMLGALALVAAGLCAWLAVVSVRFLLLIAPFEQVTPTLALPTVLIYSVFLLAFALMAVCFAGRALLLAKEV